MSHSTVLVIVNQADDDTAAYAEAERMLAPFNEELEVEPYKNYEKAGGLPITRPDQHWYYSDLVKKGHEIPDLATLARVLNETWDDEERHGADEQGLYQMSTYNPQSKWDFYQLGGRWTGFFMVKAAVNAVVATGDPGLFTKPAEDGTADLVQKRNVDFEMMRREQEIYAEQRWEHWLEVLASVPEEDLDYESWDSIRERLTNMDDAREEYGRQPIVKAMRSPEHRDNFGWTESPESFFYGEPNAHERWIQDAINSTAVPFAVLDSDGWTERGRMGWWGMVSDEKDADDWNASVAQLYDNLSDDAWLVLFDVHI